MSKDRRLGLRRLRRRWEEEDEASSATAEIPAVTAPWSDEVLATLARGKVIACQPIPSGSNYTFLCALDGAANGAEKQQLLAVYKPRRGEVPLWDFPDGTLYRREMAAYLVSRALGWPLIPPTVIRDGPYGAGSLQLFITPGDRSSFFRFQGQHREELRQITLFDHLVNNADRKPSHFIKARDGQVWAIDHGLTFHEDWKLRTVVFDFCEEPVPESLIADLTALREAPARVDALRSELGDLVSRREFEVFLRRVDHFIARRAFPSLDPYVNTPRGFW
jgi:Phosphatidylinositol 3- and 4-kinase